jgi:hypothetical protein
MIVLGCSWAPWDWGDCVSEKIGEAAKWAFGGFFAMLYDAIKALVVKAVEAVMKGVGFLWIRIDTPDISQNGTVGWFQVHTSYILGVVATIAVIWGAIQMAVSHRGEPLRDILKSLLTLVIVSSAGVTFAATLIKAADAFSWWIITQAIGADDNAFANKLAEKMVNPLKDNGVGLALTVIVGIMMVITGIVQLALMIVRYGMLVLLCGILPLTAAATNTEKGMMWFKQAVGWLAGFILYKPVAALIYATAIKLIATPAAPDNATIVEGAEQTLKVIMGIAMMLLAVVALPAILRFVSPRTS